MSEIVSIVKSLEEIEKRIGDFFKVDLFDSLKVSATFTTGIDNIIIQVRVPEDNRVHDVTIRNVRNVISDVLGIDVKFECVFTDGDIVLEFRGRVPTDSEE